MAVCTDYERERQARIAANKARLMVEQSLRRSGRVAGRPAEFYHEDALYRDLEIDRLDAPRRSVRSVRCAADPERLLALRAGRVAALGGEEGSSGDEAAGPAPTASLIDSGRGVRVQGGRVYDSRYGVTCHWCRQKTLEDHVQCTVPGCGGGRRLPVSFCTMCLLNRHGEDMAQALASDAWVCPPCRGGCGPGCASCCNCGPCRRAAGQEPTHQLIGAARGAGFANVHDYLVHRATGEGPEAVASRKARHAWGAWLDIPYVPGPPASQGKAPAAPAAPSAACEVAGGTASQDSLAPHSVAISDGIFDLEPACDHPCAAGVQSGTAIRRTPAARLTAVFAATKSNATVMGADKGQQDEGLSRKQRVLKRMGLFQGR